MTWVATYTFTARSKSTANGRKMKMLTLKEQERIIIRREGAWITITAVDFDNPFESNKRVVLDLTVNEIELAIEGLRGK